MNVYFIYTPTTYILKECIYLMTNSISNILFINWPLNHNCKYRITKSWISASYWNIRYVNNWSSNEWFQLYWSSKVVNNTKLTMHTAVDFQCVQWRYTCNPFTALLLAYHNVMIIHFWRAYISNFAFKNSKRN